MIYFAIVYLSQDFIFQHFGMDTLQKRISECLGKVLMYTKDGCPFCIRANELLTGMGVEPIIEVIDDNTKPEIRSALAEISNGDTRLPR